jgi:hypothetical protein
MVELVHVLIHLLVQQLELVKMFQVLIIMLVVGVVRLMVL